MSRLPAGGLFQGRKPSIPVTRIGLCQRDVQFLHLHMEVHLRLLQVGDLLARTGGLLAMPVREALINSFDKLRTNGNPLIPFVVSLSNQGRN